MVFSDNVLGPEFKMERKPMIVKLSLRRPQFFACAKNFNQVGNRCYFLPKSFEIQKYSCFVFKIFKIPTNTGINNYYVFTDLKILIVSTVLKHT
jgi:hypothetical protein